MAYEKRGTSWDREERNKQDRMNKELYDGMKRIDSTIDDLVIHSGGSSNAEVVQARGGFSTLNSRLSDITSTLSKKASVSDLEDNSKELKDFVQNVMQSVEGMNPKGAFETLSDLEDAFPNGTNGIYVVQEDGNWYYYGGSEWRSGGKYQADNWQDFMYEENEDWSAF